MQKKLNYMEALIMHQMLLNKMKKLLAYLIDMIYIRGSGLAF